jgi:hypothetical protein
MFCLVTSPGSGPNGPWLGSGVGRSQFHLNVCIAALTIGVTGSDPFGLDADGDGIGCE